MPSSIHNEYPDSIDIIENEVINLQFASKKLTKQNISLVKIGNDNEVLSNHFDKVKFNKKELQNEIQISNLPAGDFILLLKKLDKRILITAHDGERWGSNQ
jgi:hypothetical protein